MEKLEEVIPKPYLANINDFSACIETEATSFRPFGDLLHSFKKIMSKRTENSQQNVSTTTNGHGEEKTFEIYSCDTSVPKFANYLKRMESFILWFIDAASFIDPEDVKWKFFVL